MVKIGLVLSGGGARGFAQIGALRILKQNNIKINDIAGCSIGALIGACYAHDANPNRIEKLLKKISTKRDLYDYAFSFKGFIKGKKLEQYIFEYFADSGKSINSYEFKDLEIPLHINATDIVNGEEITFNKGLLIPAIMASLSYPGFFTTRKYNNILCVDGGVVDPLPLNLLKNDDYLILLDVSEEQKKIDEKSNIKDIVLQAILIMQKTIVEKNIHSCKKKYMLIRPPITNIGVFDFYNPESLIKAGENEALLFIDKLRRDIKQLSRSHISKKSTK